MNEFKREFILRHTSLGNNPKSKYYTKIDIGNGKSRYFYTKDEYDAYMNSKNKIRNDVYGVNRKVKKAANDLKNVTINNPNHQVVTDELRERAAKTGNFLKKAGKKAVSAAGDAVDATKKKYNESKKKAEERKAKKEAEKAAKKAENNVSPEVKDLYNDIAGDKKNTTKTETTSKPTPKKSTDEVSKEVIRGDWGNGKERRDRLTEAGYNYDEVQNEVNSKLKKKKKK